MQKNKNTQALFIGLILIIAISMLTFLRNSADTERAREESEKISKEEDLMIESSPKISIEELSKKINSKEDLFIVDLRDNLSYEKEHIPNSENIPADSVIETLQSLNKDRSYVIVDFGPNDEMAALMANKLKSSGFANVAYLDGGFSKWKSGYYSVVSEGDPNSFTDQSKVTYIQTEALKKLMETEKNLVLIDVREVSLFKEGHLKNALNIPLANLEQRKKEIPMGRKIVLYDENGMLAFKAAVKFFDMGIFNTATLSDGLRAWREKKYEIVK